MRACRACHKWFDGYAPWDFGAVQSGHMWDISHQNLSMACLTGIDRSTINCIEPNSCA